MHVQADSSQKRYKSTFLASLTGGVTTPCPLAHPPPDSYSDLAQQPVTSVAGSSLAPSIAPVGASCLPLMRTAVPHNPQQQFGLPKHPRLSCEQAAVKRLHLPKWCAPGKWQSPCVVTV